MNKFCRWWQHSCHTPWIKLLFIHLTWLECKGKRWANAMKSIATECWFWVFSPCRLQRRLTRRLDKSLFVILRTAAWGIQSINQRLRLSKMWIKFLNGERHELSVLRSLAVDICKAMKNSATQFIIFWEIFHQSDIAYHGYSFCLESSVSDAVKGNLGAAGREFRVAHENQSPVCLESFEDPFHHWGLAWVSTKHQHLNFFYLVHQIAMKWNRLLSMPAKPRWA